MSEIKISQLGTSSGSLPDDVLMIVQNGVNKKIKFSDVLGNLNSSNTIKINSIQNAVSTYISSRDNSTMFVVDGVNNKVGIGTAYPTQALSVKGSITAGSGLLNQDGVFIGSSESVSWNDADPTKNISSVRSITYLSSTGSNIGNTTNSCQFSLVNGIDGQIKFISLLANPGVAFDINYSGLSGTTAKIHMTAAGDGVTLVFRDTSGGAGTGYWLCTGKNGSGVTIG